MNRQRDFDPRSKSTSNLHVNTSFEPPEQQHPGMRGAASVGMLHHGMPGYPQYSPGGRRPDMRPNDYENQPQVACLFAPSHWFFLLFTKTRALISHCTQIVTTCANFSK
jgi:hypothetical protein